MWNKITRGKWSRKRVISKYTARKTDFKAIASTKAKEVSQIKPRLGQERAGLRCKIKIPISKLIVQVLKKLVEKNNSA